MSSIIFIVVLYHKKINLTKPILFGFTILGAMHIFGGNAYISGTRIYDIWFILPNILKYDNIVHSFGIFVATFVVYNFLNPYLNKKMNHNHFLFSLALISTVIGISAFN